MTTSLIKTEVQSFTGIITLNRSDKLNALNKEMADGISEAIAKMEADSSIRVIVITGDDKAFAAGWDTENYRARPSMNFYASKPMVAAVAGYAVGSGMEIVLNADIVLAADNAVFAVPEVTIGEIDDRVAKTLVSQVGRAVANDMLMTGRLLSAAEALGVGLVSRVVQLPNLMREALAVAERLSGLPESTLKNIKTIDRN
jgi:enoyl-CoA hydratase